MKRILSCFLMMLIVCSCSLAYAEEVPNQSANESEYDTVRYYAELTNEEMSKIGYSEKEIAEINSYKKAYAENLLKYAYMPKTELCRMGFSPIQIQALEMLRTKNVNLGEHPSEEEINSFLKQNASKAAAATISMSVTKYSSSNGKNTFKATWNWNGRPVVVGFHDTIAFGWTNGHTLTSYSNLNATLTCDSSVSPTYTVPTSYKDTDIPDQAVRFKFPTASSGGWLYHHGTCYLTLANDDNKSTTTMSWKYAHGTIQITGFGISITGGSLTVNNGSTLMKNGLKQFTGLQ